MALSNGASSSTDALLKGGSLDGFIEEVFSVEDVKLSKPRREVYLHVAQTLSVEPVELALVAAHAWDTHSAKAAGLLAAFVARGQPYPTVMLPADLEGWELIDVTHVFVNLRISWLRQPVLGSGTWDNSFGLPDLTMPAPPFCEAWTIPAVFPPRPSSGTAQCHR